MNKKQPLFSIIIPAYNEQEYITDCLNSIQNQNVDFDYEVIVVNNGSTDNTVQLAIDFDYKIINEPQRGVGRARKAGTQVASGQYVLHIDADTVLPSDYLKLVLDKFNKEPNLACLGGQFIFKKAPWWKNIFRFIFFKIVKLGSITLGRGQIGPIANNMAFKKDLYNKVRGFDPELIFGEDADLSRQLSQHGLVELDMKLSCQVSDRRYNCDLNFLRLLFNLFKLTLKLDTRKYYYQPGSQLNF